MSKRTEDRYEKWYTAHLTECAREFTLGRKVYRARYDVIEEGEIVKIARGRYDFNRFFIEDINGDVTMYHAKFSMTWESQIDQWKWFYKKSDAEKQLVKEMKARAEECRKEAQRWDEKVAKLENKESQRSETNTVTSVELTN